MKDLLDSQELVKQLQLQLDQQVCSQAHLLAILGPMTSFLLHIYVRLVVFSTGKSYNVQCGVLLLCRA